MRKPEKYTICHLVGRSVEEFSGRIALGYVGEEGISYRSMGERITEVSGMLESMNIQKGDRVALLGENSPNWGIAYLSVLCRAAVVVPILPDFHEDEILTILEHSETSLVFVSEKQYTRIGKSLEKKKIPWVMIEKLEPEVKKSESTLPQAGCFTCNDNLVGEDDLAALIYTSGTTGSSKGVMLTHKNISWLVNQSLSIQDVNENDRFLSILPMSHTLENSLGFLLPLHTGASVYYIRKQPVAPSVMLDAFQKIRPTILLTVPMIIEKIYRKQVLPKFNKSPLSRSLFKFKPTRILLNRLAGKKLLKVFGGELRFFGIGGAKLDGQIERYLREAGFPYAIGYGLTETAPLLAGSPPEKTVYQSTGYSLDGVSLKLININEETGEGEIVAMGPNVMLGYYKNEEITKSVFTEDGYFRTGDLGYIDRKGVIYIRGRIKNVIVGTNGENIYPEEIESLINGLDAVEESLVIQMQGRIVAMVNINLHELEDRFLRLNEKVLEITHETMDDVLAEIQKFVNQRVNKFSRLHQVILQPVPFEKTPTRKIKRYLYGG